MTSDVCNLVRNDEASLWHKRLGNVSLQSIRKTISAEVVLGIPSPSREVDGVCGDCQLGKQIRVSHKKVSQCSTEHVPELLHKNLMGPMQVESLGLKRYVFVCVGNFSRYTWVRFIRDKSDTFQVCQTLCCQIQCEQGCQIVRIQSDHG